MNTDLHLIKQLLDSPTGISLKQYLLSATNDLKNIDNLKDYSNSTDIAIEVKSQKKAYHKMLDILEKIISFEEGNEEIDKEEDYSG